MVRCISCAKRASKRNLSQGAFCEMCLKKHLNANPGNESYEEIEYTLSDCKKKLFADHAKIWIELYKDYIAIIENEFLRILKIYNGKSNSEKKEIRWDKHAAVYMIKRKIKKIKILCNLEIFTYAEFKKVKNILKMIPIYEKYTFENYQYKDARRIFSNILSKTKIDKLDRYSYKDILFHKLKYPITESDEIESIALTADREFLCSAFKGGKICIWDIATKNVYKYFDTKIDGDKSFCCVALGINSRMAISNKYQKIYGWNIDTGKQEFELSGHGKVVTHIKLSKNEQYLASKSEDSTIKLWDLIKREEVCSIPLSQIGLSWVPSMMFYKNDEYFVYPNMNISFWNIAKNELEKVIFHENILVLGFAIYNDEKKMLYIDNDFIKIWDLDEWKDITEGDPKNIKLMAFYDIEISYDYQYAFIKTKNFQKNIIVWEISEGKRVFEISEERSNMVSYANFNQTILTNENKAFIACCNMVVIYDLFEHEISSLIGYLYKTGTNISRNFKYCAKISKMDKRVALFIYDLEKGTLISSFVVDESNASEDSIITNCGNYIIMNIRDESTVIIDTRSPKIIKRLDPTNSDFDNEVIPNYDKFSAMNAIVSKDQKYVLIYGPNSFWVWRLNDHKLLYQKCKVKRICVSPDMTYAIILDFNALLYWNINQKKVEAIVTRSYVSRLKQYSKSHLIVFYSQFYHFWDCRAKKEIARIEAVQRAYDVSTTGKFAFIISECEKKILRYNLEDLSNQTIDPFGSYKEELKLLSLATDDSFIVLETSNSIYIYDFINNAQRIEISSNQFPISLACVPDSKSFLIGLQDGSAILWDANINAEVWKEKFGESAVVSIIISEDGLQCALEFKSKIYKVLNCKNGKILDLNGLKRGQDLRFSADCKSVIAVNKRLVAKIYDISTASEIEEIDLIERERRFFNEYPEFMEFRDGFKELRLDD